MQAVEDLGLKVSYAEDNAHLCLSFLMCAAIRSCAVVTRNSLQCAIFECFELCRAACALTGQFLPGKLADHKPTLTACVATYYVLCAVSFFFGRFVTQEYFLVLLASPENKLPKLRLMFKMKRLDDKFSLVIVSKDQYAPHHVLYPRPISDSMSFLNNCCCHGHENGISIPFGHLDFCIASCVNCHPDMGVTTSDVVQDSHFRSSFGHSVCARGWLRREGKVSSVDQGSGHSVQELKNEKLVRCFGKCK